MKVEDSEEVELVTAVEKGEEKEEVSVADEGFVEAVKVKVAGLVAGLVGGVSVMVEVLGVSD